jgi:hypothetical protein
VSSTGKRAVQFGVCQFVLQSAVLYGPFHLVDANGTWKLITQLVLDVILGPSHELVFRTTILPRDKDRKKVGGVAYIKDGLMKPTLKVFSMYPSKQKAKIPSLIDGYECFCLYYGTMVDQPMKAFTEGNQMPNGVPWATWRLYVGLGAEIIALEESWKTANGTLETAKGALEESNRNLKTTNEALTATNGLLTTANRDFEAAKVNLNTANEKLENANKDLERVKEELGTANGKVNGLETANKELTKEVNRLETANKELTKEVNRLKAIAKAVVDAIEGLKTYDNNKTLTTAKDETSTETTTAKDGTSTETPTTAANGNSPLDGQK